jgi:hypothetical protein
MAIIREFKKRVTQGGKTSNQTWVEVSCPICDKRRTLSLSQHKRNHNGEYCTKKHYLQDDNPNNNWWEDAYAEILKENPNKSGGHIKTMSKAGIAGELHKKSKQDSWYDARIMNANHLGF